MERGSAKHGARVDEEMEREAAEMARATPSVRAEQWPDPEEPLARPGGAAEAEPDPETEPDPQAEPDPGTTR
jgi:hypothetical protein